MERSMMSTVDRNASELRKHWFWVQEERLSDGSFAYNVMFDETEIYAAISEEDAIAMRKKFEDVMEVHNRAKAAKGKNRDTPLIHRLSAMSYNFKFDGPEANTLCEAVKLIERLAANQKS